MGIPSLLRREEHRALSKVKLSGRVLDLGGDKNSSYLACFQGEFTATSVNFSSHTHPDLLHDLEQPLPLADASYDHVLLINVLEHIFEYRQLLEESARVLMPGGSIVIIVPFLFPVHPSPEDYRRFTASALARELAAAGFEHIAIEALGSGPFAVRYLMLDRLLPKPIRLISFYTFRYVAALLDTALAALARATGRQYRAQDYALGYSAIARKS